MNASRVVVLSLALATWSSASAAKDVDVNKQIANINRLCFAKSSMAEGRGCLADQEDRIKRKMDAALRKQGFSISEISKRSPNDGPPYPETSVKAKELLDKEQASWIAYSTNLCERQFELSQKTAGAEDDMAVCRLTSYLRRINDLE
ncbi:uncharacterized protein YecT (DUF1311 family) [Methylobacterium sp. RAS18]|nr:uncharacterized protein YecT (DUF1311 family) [Methylobacterium sp. RAS18]